MGVKNDKAQEACFLYLHRLAVSGCGGIFLFLQSKNQQGIVPFFYFRSSGLHCQAGCGEIVRTEDSDRDIHSHSIPGFSAYACNDLHFPDPGAFCEYPRVDEYPPEFYTEL
jgi:hypothetical protein